MRGGEFFLKTGLSFAAGALATYLILENFFYWPSVRRLTEENRKIAEENQQLRRKQDSLDSFIGKNAAPFMVNLDDHARVYSVEVPFDHFSSFADKNHYVQRSQELVSFVTHNDPVIRQAAKSFRDRYGLDRLVAEAIVRFVQRKIYYPAQVNDEAYVSYPVETLVRGYGVCEDSSVLCAAFLKAAGFDAALLNFGIVDKGPKHITAGIAGNFFGDSFPEDGKQYFIIECTGEFAIGETPERLKGITPAVYPIR